MNACRLESAHPTSVTEVENVCCRNPGHRLPNQLDELLVFRNARNVRLRVIEEGHFRWNKLREAPASPGCSLLLTAHSAYLAVPSVFELD
jgi:hypothetical protein